jgi:hypothetical protein
LWLIESEARGHTVSETMRYLSDVANHADARAEREQTGVDYVVAAPAPWWRKWRLFW